MPSETQVVLTGIIVTTIIGLFGWGLHRILIEPLDENTKAVRRMADEFKIFNEGRSGILEKMDNISCDIKYCQEDIDRCNARLANLAKATGHADVIL